MAGEKQQQQCIDGKLARKFIKSLAKELASDSDRGFYLASNTQDMKDALLKSADSLPAGKLHSTLLLVLQQQTLQEAFVSALQNEIRALSAKLELHSDVLLTSPASDRVFQTIITCVRGTGTSLFTDTKSRHVFSHEDIHLLVSRDPAPDILWALAAMKLSSTKSVMPALKNSSTDDAKSAFSICSSSASAFFRCVKPWIVGRSASIAVAALAPLAPIVFESLQQSSSRSIINVKALQALIKEVLSFIVVVNCKEDFTTKGSSLEYGLWECLSLSALSDGFSAVFKASKLQDIVTQMEGLSMTEKLKLMFPLASGLTKKAFKVPDVKISVLADIVKVEFLLLHTVLEVIYCRHKTIVGGQVGVTHGGLDDEILREPVGSAAISGLSGVQNDLILDVLLSDLPVSNLLDDREKSLVCLSILKALLMENNRFSKKHVPETSASSRKAVGTFLKRIAVARKIKTSERTRSDILEDLICYSKVPHKLADYLKSCSIIKKLPEKALLNDRALFGWLLHLDDPEFQAIVDGTSRNDSQVHEKMGVEKDDLYAVRSSPDYPSEKNSFNQDESEDLFFLDTTGEENGQADNCPSPIRKSRKTRKRKERSVLFHRHGRATKRKEAEGQIEGSSDSSDSMPEN